MTPKMTSTVLAQSWRGHRQAGRDRLEPPGEGMQVVPDEQHNTWRGPRALRKHGEKLSLGVELNEHRITLPAGGPQGRCSPEVSGGDGADDL